ncbi:Transmembrane protein 6/97 [Kalmanozyma brasiliensis GHG001]|uniref:Transmembrane protein 6/97 n=1 Tax=Kalmanozyma brasiliensis (strain GHG001) TaxID=1365824 RepID=UPI002868155E|nr:Transmembrane protein 6/97 [Kalmanozyma brasiliensis GHG001]KAF6767156.1 Transmembrane protein 6/97 [Kalmanozyma brasiliensis GHG001]
MSTRPATTALARRQPLTSRPLDILYLSYFVIHLAASVAIDAQLAYPPYSQRLFPEPLRKVLADYLTSSKDPFLLAAARGSADHVWFRVLLISEAVFQIPCFVVAIWGLIHDEKRTYPLMVCYGTLAASSTLQCICSILFGSDGRNLTSAQITALLQNYVPFCLIPTLLTVDMMLRIMGLLSEKEATKGGKDE